MLRRGWPTLGITSCALMATAPAAEAGVVDVFGFGAESIGRGGGGLGLVDDAAAVFLNPAALPRMTDGQALIGYSFLRTRFRPLPDVRWDTNQDGVLGDDDAPLRLASRTDRADGLHFALGRPLGRRFGMSVAGFVPIDRLIRIQTFEPAIPTYVMYQNRLSRYELALGFGWEQLRGLRLGGAVEMVARSRLMMDATMTLPVDGTADPGEGLGSALQQPTLDTHAAGIDIAPAFAPIVSGMWEVGEQVEALAGLRLVGAWRGAVDVPVQVDINLQVNGQLDDLGEVEPLVASVVAPIQVDIYDHFVPARAQLGLAWERPRGSAYVDVQRAAWDRLKVNVATVTGGGLDAQLVELDAASWADGNPYRLVVRPTWGVRAGGELGLPRIPAAGAVEYVEVRLRAGGGYEPTPLVTQGSGSSMLDADRSFGALGLTVEHKDPFAVVSGPIQWHLYGQLHVLAQGALQTADPDRAGAPIDGGDVPIGGRLLAAGTQWSFDF